MEDSLGSSFSERGSSAAKKREYYQQLEEKDALVLLLERSSATHRLLKDISQRLEQCERIEASKSSQTPVHSSNDNYPEHKGDYACCWPFWTLFGQTARKKHNNTPSSLERGQSGSEQIAALLWSKEEKDI